MGQNRERGRNKGRKAKKQVEINVAKKVRHSKKRITREITKWGYRTRKDG